MSLKDYSWMLNDPERLGAFRRAIEHAVRPGDIVVEIGAGLGTYSFFACQAGAARVYAIEDGASGALESLAKRQNFGDRLKVIRENSVDATLPEKADLIIYEDFNSAFLGAGLGEVVHDATKRFLKPEGRWLPPEAVLCGALIEVPNKWDELAMWHRGIEVLDGLDFSPLSGWLLNSEIRGKCPPESFVTEPRDLRRYRFGNLDEKYDLTWRTEETAARSGTVHGICVWFRLDFSGGEVLDNAPGANRTVYEQEFFPLSAPVPVEKGDRVEWSLDCVPGAGEYELWWNWRVASEAAAAEGTTFASFPASVEELKKQSGEHVPRLDADRQILKFILNAADGKLTQAEIATKVQVEFPDEILSGKDALRRVARALGE